MKAKGIAQPESVPNEEEEEINLEHVLPKHPETTGQLLIQELATAYYNRMGHMVLLQAKKNSTIGNASFADKRKVLATSTYVLTAEVGKTKNWSVAGDSRRKQKRLAKYAVETWPLAHIALGQSDLFRNSCKSGRPHGVASLLLTFFHPA